MRTADEIMEKKEKIRQIILDSNIDVHGSAAFIYFIYIQGILDALDWVLGEDTEVVER